MPFTSIAFLYFFLPAVLLCCTILPRRFQNAALLVFSLLFYIYGEPVYVLLILAQALSGYLHGLWIEKAVSPRWKKTALISALVIGIGCLGVFKYADLFVSSINRLTGASWKLLRLALPIGISFYTFQTISYVIDVYRGAAHAQRNPVDLFTYVLLFPQLIAGPIVRYTDIASELKSRRTTLEGFALGVRRFTVGLGKKVLLANVLGELVAAVDPEASVLGAWLAAVGYALQIYFDFSGYSDMAIGLGRMFGFTFPENFNYPYISRSVTDFWRRWHITLSRWFRDYVYIPLGGNRVSKPRWMLNILVVWALTGLWHGASWTFLLWGVYYALLLMAEKLFLLRGLDKMPRFVGRVWLLLTVAVGFTLFRCQTLSQFASQLYAMFGKAPLWDALSLYQLRNYAFVLLAAALGATPLMAWLMKRLPHKARNIAECVLIPACVLVSTAFLVDGSFNPFLYFRF